MTVGTEDDDLAIELGLGDVPPDAPEPTGAWTISDEVECWLLTYNRNELESMYERLDEVMGDTELVWIRERWGAERTLQVGAEFAERAIDRGMAVPTERPGWWRRLVGGQR